MIRIVIADDHTIMREGLKRILDGALDIEIVGEAINGFEVLSLVRQGGFDLLLLDLSMPDVDGFELIYQLAESQPVEPVIISSGLSSDIKQAARLVCESLNIRVLGILSKPFAKDELALFLQPYARALAEPYA